MVNKNLSQKGRSNKYIIRSSLALIALCSVLIIVQLFYPKSPLHQQVTSSTEEDKMRHYLSEKYDQDFTMSSKASEQTTDKNDRAYYAYARPSESSNPIKDNFKVQRPVSSDSYTDNYPERKYSQSEQTRVTKSVNSASGGMTKNNVLIFMPEDMMAKISGKLPDFSVFSQSQAPESIDYRLSLFADVSDPSSVVSKHSEYLYNIWKQLDLTEKSIKLSGSYMIRGIRTNNGDSAPSITCKFDRAYMQAIENSNQLTDCFKTSGVKQ